MFCLEFRAIIILKIKKSTINICGLTLRCKEEICQPLFNWQISVIYVVIVYNLIYILFNTKLLVIYAIFRIKHFNFSIFRDILMMICDDVLCHKLLNIFILTYLAWPQYLQTLSGTRLKPDNYTYLHCSEVCLFGYGPYLKVQYSWVWLLCTRFVNTGKP